MKLKLLALVLVISFTSCSINRKPDIHMEFLEQSCGTGTLRSILIDDSTYPGIAMENWIEAVIDFEIVVGEKIEITSKNEHFYVYGELEEIDPKFKTGEIFSKKIKRKITNSCPGIKIGYQEFRVAYKLRQLNFNPTFEEIDLIIERDTLQLITIQSHIN